MSEQNVAHTPTPWKAGSFSSVVGCPISAQPDPKKNTVIVAGVHGAFGDDYRSEVEANARFIVRAVNSHAELVKHLGNAIDALASWNVSPIGGLPVMRAALSRARGEGE
jgi:hypothetical protein